jgi:hypothetical protein
MAEDEKMLLNDEINTKVVETGLKRSFLNWLRPLRLMSKSFDKAITPIAYHSYDLSRWPIMGKLVECLAQEGSVDGGVGVQSGVDKVMVRTVAFDPSILGRYFEICPVWLTSTLGKHSGSLQIPRPQYSQQ